MLAGPLLAALASLAPVQSPEKLAETYADAVEALNRDHARAPGKTTEAELAKKLPPAASAALEKLLARDDSAETAEALFRAGEAALDLDLTADFERVRARLAVVSAKRAAALGTALSRERFLLRGLGGLDADYLERFAEVLDAILDAYGEVFGFAELSKVPGKKLRVRVRLVETIDRPPHFAPEFPYHSEIDFPVVDRERLRSPTADGKFLFYGLCHELGHVVAMWGSAGEEQDHHAWAHYTGCVIVDHLSSGKSPGKWMAELRDAKWRSLEALREEAAKAKPSLDDRAGVLAVLVGLHDRVGPKAIGAALNALDREDKRLRVNGVRYYTFAELRQALLDATKDKKQRRAIEELLPAR